MSPPSQRRSHEAISASRQGSIGARGAAVGGGIGQSRGSLFGAAASPDGRGEAAGGGCATGGGAAGGVPQPRPPSASPRSATSKYSGVASIQQSVPASASAWTGGRRTHAQDDEDSPVHAVDELRPQPHVFGSSALHCVGVGLCRRAYVTKKTRRRA